MTKNKTYRHLFFDLDNTLTRSRTEIENDLYNTLQSAAQDLVIVSGASCEQIAKQTRNISVTYLGQNGNHALNGKKKIWQRKLSETQCKEIYKHIRKCQEHVAISVRDKNDLVEYRGCQISYSAIGHNEDIERKENFDPDGSVRTKLLCEIPFKSKELDVKIGGTTCLDYISIDGTKGENIKRLIALRGWDINSCLYFGDQLFPGGNDETVIGVIETQSVENPRDTLRILKQMVIS